MLKDVDLKKFLADVDKVIEANEKAIMGGTQTAHVEPAKEAKTVTTEETSVEPVVTQDALIKGIKADSQKSKQNWVMLVSTTDATDVLEFENAVRAAEHFKIHPTTVRTRCKAETTHDNYKWQYVK